jgi:hypothetical protein
VLWFFGQRECPIHICKFPVLATVAKRFRNECEKRTLSPWLDKSLFATARHVRHGRGASRNSKHGWPPRRPTRQERRTARTGRGAKVAGRGQVRREGEASGVNCGAIRRRSVQFPADVRNPAAKHACHIPAGWAFIPDQSRLICERRNPHHLVHYGFASRTCKAAALRNVCHAGHDPLRIKAALLDRQPASLRRVLLGRKKSLIGTLPDRPYGPLC